LNAQLGDKRLVRRLVQIAEAAEHAPSASLPQRAGTSAALEGTYRFLSNPRVDPEAIFDCHASATCERAAHESEVLVVHDTTEFRFGGEQPRAGMGWISSDNKDGFLAHFSLCLTPEGRPLGTVGLHAWVRQGAKGVRKAHAPQERHPDRESQRWQDSALQVASRLHQKTKVIHIMDREGDQFELLSMLVEHGQRFIVRIGHNRRLELGRGRTTKPMLFQSLSSSPYFFTREVHLSTRRRSTGAKNYKVYPPRKSRLARLEVRAGSYSIYRSHVSEAHVPLSLPLQVVEVREVNAPDGEALVIWRIVTTEPAQTQSQVAAIVDAYRQRWQIEEFFKALKTGCRYQQLQLETVKALLCALSIEVAVAWQLLLLRWSVRHQASAGALNVLDAKYLDVIRALHSTNNLGPALSTLTVENVLSEIAKLGGHIRGNGPPGWLVLRRGFDALVAIQRGWELARGSS